ncbi:GDSL-type esterase/lipase family protein [bacterium]|nr:GDSL-type esterase/lipase family protein [bacterium]MDC0311736.1 GDSL-type esterase/lipase family protein [bacterium]
MKSLLCSAALVLLAFQSSIAQDAKPAVKIACIGDSITFGHGIKDPEGTYPAQLQQILGAESEVRNFGNSGRSILKKSMRGKQKRAFIFMKEHEDALAFEPDIVICNLGINDLMDFDKFEDDFVTDYIELLTAYQSLASKPRIIVWASLAPLFKGHAFFEDARIEKINREIVKVVKKMDIESIDMERPLRNEDALFPDNIHPNAGGAAIIAKVTAALLKKTEIK